VIVAMENRRDSCGREPDLAGQRAGNLLRAWISGDAGRFQREIESTLSDHTRACGAGEEERRNLLRAVAIRLTKCPNVFGLPRTAGLDLCLTLLGHLVAEDTGGTGPEQPEKKGYRSREYRGGTPDGGRLSFPPTCTSTQTKPWLRPA
jgi:hypothetical protein